MRSISLNRFLPILYSLKIFSRHSVYGNFTGYYTKRVYTKVQIFHGLSVNSGYEFLSVFIKSSRNRWYIDTEGGKSNSSHPYQNHLYFSILYFSARLILSSSGRDFIYFFHPGHHVACHLHILPSNDWGLLSYFALNAQFSHLWLAIGILLTL